MGESGALFAMSNCGPLAWRGGEGSMYLAVLDLWDTQNDCGREGNCWREGGGLCSSDELYGDNPKYSRFEHARLLIRERDF